MPRRQRNKKKRGASPRLRKERGRAVKVKRKGEADCVTVNEKAVT